MPRRGTSIKYGKAARTPSERHKEAAPRSSRAFVPPMNKPKARTEIVEFVESRRQTPRPYAETLDLVREFHATNGKGYPKDEDDGDS